jgi:hypothetical protein
MHHLEMRTVRFTRDVAFATDTSDPYASTLCATTAANSDATALNLSASSSCGPSEVQCVYWRSYDDIFPTRVVHAIVKGHVAEAWLLLRLLPQVELRTMRKSLFRRKGVHVDGRPWSTSAAWPVYLRAANP